MSIQFSKDNTASISCYHPKLKSVKPNPIFYLLQIHSLLINYFKPALKTLDVIFIQPHCFFLILVTISPTFIIHLTTSVF